MFRSLVLHKQSKKHVVFAKGNLVQELAELQKSIQDKPKGDEEQRELEELMSELEPPSSQKCFLLTLEKVG